VNVIEVDAETGEQRERAATTDEQAVWKQQSDAALTAEQAEDDAAAKRAADEQAWRDAVGNASSLAALKDALLGTNLPAQAAARPTDR
jgi:hypothetical protein